MWFRWFALILLTLFGSTKLIAGDVTFAVPANSVSGVFYRSLLESKDLNAIGARLIARSYENENELLSDILKGSVDVGLLSLDAFVQHKFDDPPRLAAIFTHPFLFDTAQDIIDVQAAPLGSAVLADINRTGLVPISFWNQGVSQLVTKNPITSVRDFASLKIASARNTNTSTILTNLGASETSFPANRIPTMLTSGSFNAVILDRAPEGFFKSVGPSFVVPARPLVGVFVAARSYWSKLSEAERRSWNYASNVAAKNAMSDVFQQAAAAREFAKFESLKLNPGQKFSLIRVSVTDEALLTEQIKLVEDALTSARALRSKKKTEIDRPLIQPQPSIVVYVTDRNETGTGNVYDGFGSERREDWGPTCGGVQFKTAVNRDPGDPYHGRIDLNPKRSRGISACAKHMASLIDQTSNRVLIYVHGYHNTFEDAIKRTIMMAHDLRFGGLILTWNWPSDGLSDSYFFDEDAARWTVTHFSKFFAALLNQAPRSRIDILVHSLGTRVLLGALRDIKTIANQSVNSIVFAAPDEAQDIFQQTLVGSGQVAGIQTLYGSENDRALYVSRWVHSSRGKSISRAGDGGTNILIMKGLESVDASDLVLDYFGHAYVFEHPKAIADVKQILSESKPAEQRGLQTRHRQQQIYWALPP